MFTPLFFFRSPRPDEVNGISYHFVSNDTFHEMVRDGMFLEWAGVHDNSYGTSIEAFKAGNTDESSHRHLMTEHVAKHVIQIIFMSTTNLDVANQLLSCHQPSLPEISSTLLI